MRQTARWWLLAGLLMMGCGDDATSDPPAQGQAGLAGQAGSGGSGGQDGYGAGGAVVGTECSVDVAQHPLLPTIHVEECSKLGLDSYNSNPPSSGNHYGTWAAFKSYTQPIPRGYLLHSMEHGAVVFFYNCPEGCAADVARLEAVIAALPEDKLCTDPAGPRRRLILVPEPTLDVRFAAASWGWTMRAPCADQGAFRAFALQHYAQATEDFCNDGTDVVARGITPGCGQ